MLQKNKINTNNILAFQNSKINQKFRGWREVVDKNSEFQHILRLLIQNYSKKDNEKQQSLNYLRQAICICKPEEMRIFIQHLGGYLYQIVCQIELQAAYMTTTWLHEDGIQSERDARVEQKQHPIHTLLCLTDFYKKYSKRIDIEENELFQLSLKFMEK